MYSRGIIAALLAFGHIASGELLDIVRDAEISLTCQREYNYCLEAGPGNAFFELLSGYIGIALETQEMSMDSQELETPDDFKTHWVFDNGKWKLDDEENAAKKNHEAKENLSLD